MIQTQIQLNDFLQNIKDQTELAIDTEFKRVDSYYPRLCLVQIATDVAINCIDILALNNLKPLFLKLYQPDTLWVIHAAKQDIEALYCLSKQLPKRLFDTQLAAGLLGYPAQISYQQLTASLQTVTLQKAYTRLDWTTRPLPHEAIEYALDDVRYLHKNYQQLRSQLKNQNKSAWIVEESNALLDLKYYKISPKQAWKKLKGLSNLSKKAQLLAIKLAAWREYQAQQKNKPRQWILKDRDIIDYALNKKPLNPKLIANFNNFLQNNPDIVSFDPVIDQHKALSENEKIQKQCLQNLIKQKANEYNFNPEIFANNKTLLKYIRDDTPTIFHQGWRFDLLKKEMNLCKTV